MNQGDFVTVNGLSSVQPSSRQGFSAGVWGILRAFTLAWAAAISTLRPLTELERTMALWPPAQSFNRWLYRVLLAPWQRWDVLWYLRIVEQGYSAGDGTAQFHPLFPWLAVPISRLTGTPLFALMLVSSLAGLFAVLMFQRLASLDLDHEGVQTATLTLLTCPLAFVLFAPYSEALFLLCAVLCFWFLRRRSWWRAGLAGALATLTRQQGLFLLLPAVWELWDVVEGDWRRWMRSWQAWSAFLLIPGGLLLWLLYRGYLLSDVAPDANSVHTLIYSLLISPSASKVVPVQTFQWPWQSLLWALSHFVQGPDYRNLIDLVLGGGFVVGLVLVWRYLRGSYRVYAVSIVLVSFAYYTGPRYPYMGLPRHLFLAFPIFLGLAETLRHRWQRLLWVMSGFIGMGFLTFLYVLNTWVP